ncbi:hypothetical protein [Brevundimonas diminuta]|uniref:hypothetical protein n=1 Tax=Brevundimonas diminuta TaxID=293 RepID=UPI003D08CA23
MISFKAIRLLSTQRAVRFIQLIAFSILFGVQNSGCYYSEKPLHSASDGIAVPHWPETSAGSTENCRVMDFDPKSALWYFSEGGGNRIEFCVFRFSSSRNDSDECRAISDNWAIVRIFQFGDNGYHYAVVQKSLLGKGSNLYYTIDRVWSANSISMSIGMKNIFASRSEIEFLPSYDLLQKINFKTKRAIDLSLIDVANDAEIATEENETRGTNICTEEWGMTRAAWPHGCLEKFLSAED